MNIRHKPALTANHVLALCAAGIAAAILFYFHNRFWWPPDDGAYGYVAQRLLRGAIFNVDVRDVHAGYVHFTHMLAFRLFGEDLASMRYPLALLTLAQAIFAYYLLLPRGRLAALAAALAAASLSFVQFLNPTANWYALALGFALWAVFAWTPARSVQRYVWAGFVVGLAIFFRQLSGAFLALAAILLAFDEQVDDDAGPSLLARTILAGITLVIIAYYISKQSVTGFFMFGLWPLLLTICVALRVRARTFAIIRVALLMALGFAIAALPMATYILWNGTVAAWFHDAVGAAFGLHGMEFIREQNFARFLLVAILGLIRDASLPGAINLLFWLAMLAGPVALGFISVRRCLLHKLPLEAGPVIAIFFAQVSAHYQIPIYLMIPAALTFAALLSLAADRKSADAAAVAVTALCSLALWFQAGQPLSRGLGGTAAGTRMPLDSARGVQRASLHMESADAALYGRIISLIEANSGKDDMILAAPFIPEFYFLSGRRSVFRSVGLPFEFTSSADAAKAIATMAANPPRVVIHRREDKYNTPAALEIIASVRKTYRLAEAVGDFDVYLLGKTP